MSKIKWCERPNLIPAPYYGLCLSEAAYLKQMKRMKLANPPPWISNSHSDATTHVLELDGKLAMLVCLMARKGVEREQIYSLLVHEGVHIWQEIRDGIGERRPSSEFEAYAVQWIAQQLFYAYQELK